MANPNSFLHLLLLLLLLSLLLPSTSSSSSNSTLTAYEALESFGFPAGILPKGVTDYVLREDGSFVVILGNLKKDCTFSVDGGYNLDYKRQISGKVERNAIHGLSGVSVKVLFLWLGITDVVVDGDDLNFYVGPLSASFGADNFDDSPQCGCGFDCLNQNRLADH